MIAAHMKCFVFAIGLLASCSPVPSFGPSDEAIVAKAQTVQTAKDAGREPLEYDLIEIDRVTVSQHGVRSRRLFSSDFVNYSAKTNEPTISVGDQLKLHIRESADDGLFATAGKRDEIITLVVSANGEVSPPFAGQVAAAGLTLSALKNKLVNIYQGRAVAPDLQLTLDKSVSAKLYRFGGCPQIG